MKVNSHAVNQLPAPEVGWVLSREGKKLSEIACTDCPKTTTYTASPKLPQVRPRFRMKWR
jgi:hypothetical protein